MRRRIVLRAVAAAVLAICLFGVPLGVGVARYYLDDERAELERMADAAALSVADELANHRPVTELPATDPDTRLGLYSPAGQLASGAGPATAESIVDNARGGQVARGETGDELVVAVPITDRGTLSGIVRASSRHSEVTVRTGWTWLAMLGLAVAAIGATWLIARRMAAGLARPLEELSVAAQRLGEGDFTVRARPAGIPEIDSVGTALNTTAQRIGETLARERAFSAQASHQLRTPLAGLRLQLEAALDSPENPRAAMADGIASADRLAGIIDDLLTLARDSRTPAGPADLDALLDEVREGWHGLLAARGRALRIDAGDAPRPTVSPAALRQILTVLVDNAVTHGRGTVAITTRDTGDVLAIDVADEGPGIDPDRDVFARDNHSGTGHGIGLALARGLAEAEGGRLVLSRPAPPTFTLLLPVS
jgi:signal transduction histidine kinase